ncbi:mechanosensitive ion channel [Vibrio sp. S11_S32]|nr:mechanosensitive ion channel domain-containing protein [Vibrio sp. S11_S32]MBD1575194.1 mechanosensitive ion channel [Vibrio sp. S11_S32]
MNQEWIAILQQYYQWIITVVVLIFYPMLRRIPARIFLGSMKTGISPHRKHRATLLLNTITSIIIIALLLMAWGIELRGLLVVGSSMFALLGVALFAGWSLLSNLTSFLILFGQNDCRVGRWVRVIDGANYIEGEITEMAFMSVQLRNIDGNVVLYPNNLFLTRPVIVLTTPPQASSPADSTKTDSSKTDSAKIEPLLKAETVTIEDPKVEKKRWMKRSRSHSHNKPM